MDESRNDEIPTGMFGVLACEARTGVVVDEFGDRATDHRPKLLCFASREEAALHCRARVRVDPETECWIYSDSGEVVAEYRSAGSRGEPAPPTYARPWLDRLFRRGTGDGFCCDSSRGCFISRESYGDFLVAGRPHQCRDVTFVAGTAMAHRADYEALLPTLNAVERAVGAFGVSNYKLLTHRFVHFCAHCGANLRRFYGPEGGALRDDTFASQLP